MSHFADHETSQNWPKDNRTGHVNNNNGCVRCKRVHALYLVDCSVLQESPWWLTPLLWANVTMPLVGELLTQSSRVSGRKCANPIFSSDRPPVCHDPHDGTWTRYLHKLSAVSE